MSSDTKFELIPFNKPFKLFVGYAKPGVEMHMEDGRVILIGHINNVFGMWEDDSWEYHNSESIVSSYRVLATYQGYENTEGVEAEDEQPHVIIPKDVRVLQMAGEGGYISEDSLNESYDYCPMCYSEDCESIKLISNETLDLLRAQGFIEWRKEVDSERINNAKEQFYQHQDSAITQFKEGNFKISTDQLDSAERVLDYLDKSHWFITEKGKAYLKQWKEENKI